MAGLDLGPRGGIEIRSRLERRLAQRAVVWPGGIDMDTRRLCEMALEQSA